MTLNASTMNAEPTYLSEIFRIAKRSFIAVLAAKIVLAAGVIASFFILGIAIALSAFGTALAIGTAITILVSLSTLIIAFLGFKPLFSAFEKGFSRSLSTQRKLALALLVLVALLTSIAIPLTAIALQSGATALSQAIKEIAGGIGLVNGSAINATSAEKLIEMTRHVVEKLLSAKPLAMMLWGVAFACAGLLISDILYLYTSGLLLMLVMRLAKTRTAVLLATYIASSIGLWCSAINLMILALVAGTWFVATVLLIIHLDELSIEIMRSGTQYMEAKRYTETELDTATHVM